MELKVRKVTDYPYDLLLLADETVEAIHRYLFESEVYIAELPETEKPVGVFCLYRIDEDTVEIKNIAVSEQYQDNGIGSFLIDHAVSIAEEKRYKQIIVGTADCGIKQIRFYEKNGFVKYDIKKDFFTDIYDIPIYENGVQLKDMVMLKRELIPQIKKSKAENYGQLLTVWESSVKATHHFLKPEDFDFYRRILPDFFSQVELYSFWLDDEIVAFMGTSGDNLEMLFVSDKVRGQGFGKQLLIYAISRLNVTKVDVNEDNIQAIGFYEKFGFRVIGRSDKDSMGKDYPILHLSL